jgi:hypothetical protein
VLWAVITDSTIVPWLVASVVADVVDFVLAYVDLEGERRNRAAALAGGFAAIGIAAIATNL